jgi:hypothetical protein
MWCEIFFSAFSEPSIAPCSTLSKTCVKGSRPLLRPKAPLTRPRGEDAAVCMSVPRRETLPAPSSNSTWSIAVVFPPPEEPELPAEASCIPPCFPAP